MTKSNSLDSGTGARALPDGTDDGRRRDLHRGLVWAIFGSRAIVAGLGEALYLCARQPCPTWRGHNEQTMAHCAIRLFETASSRKRAMAVTLVDRSRGHEHW